MLSFVVQNFSQQSPILIRTRRFLFTVSFLQSPLLFNFLSFALILGSTTPRSSWIFSRASASFYNSYFFFKRFWKLVPRLLNGKAQHGLYTSNFSVSLLYKNLCLLNNLWKITNRPSQLQLPKFRAARYYEPTALLHFALFKSSLKTIVFFFFHYLFQNYFSAQTDYQIYANYFILAQWAYFYPLYNSFYFKIYHY